MTAAHFPERPLPPWSRAVLKVGSSLLTDASGELSERNARALAQFVAAARAAGREVVLVSSGAVAAGRTRIGSDARKGSIVLRQALAALGQTRMVALWQALIEAPVAQVLLTHDDLRNRRRYLNARATLLELLRLRSVPVVNENDTVATQEIRYGDNDRLAARVAQMIGADLLVLLSDVDGLYTADPRRDPDARHVPHVGELTAEIEAMGGGANADHGVGTGGMATKLAAVRIAAAAGCSTLITLGRRSAPLKAVEDGERATLFEPALSPAAAYKAWIAGALAPQGALVVDDGAATALKSGKSLLAAGVRAVEGRFGKGDAVLVRALDGAEIARGLARYDAADATRIRGLKSDAIEAAIGYSEGPMIHADDLALSRR
jgi:glutamate 5-kinase